MGTLWTHKDLWEPMEMVEFHGGAVGVTVYRTRERAKSVRVEVVDRYTVRRIRLLFERGEDLRTAMNVIVGTVRTLEALHPPKTT